MPTQLNTTHVDAERGARPELFAAGATAGEIEAIRAIAAARGLAPVQAVLAAIDRAGAQPRLAASMLPILRDALRSGRADAQAASVYAGACALRLGV